MLSIGTIEPLDFAAGIYTYPNTSLCSLGITETYTRNTISFFVEKNHIGDVGDFGAFFTDIFLDLEYRSRVFLQRG